MQKRIIMKLLVGVIVAEIAVLASAQTTSTVSTEHRYPLEITVSYNAIHSSEVSGSSFWMQGGGIQIHGQFYGPLGVVADVSGAHVAKMKATSAGLDIVTATFGPRFTWPLLHSRYTIFGQALLGEANGFNSVFPSVSGTTTSQNSMALKVGGGVTIRLKPRVAWRACEINWLRTQLPNSTNNVQNNATFATGVTFSF